MKIAKEIEDEERKVVSEQRRIKREMDNQFKREEKAKRATEKERLEEEKLQQKVYNAIHFPPGSTIFAVPDKMKHKAPKKNVLPLK